MNASMSLSLSLCPKILSIFDFSILNNIKEIILSIGYLSKNFKDF